MTSWNTWLGGRIRRQTSGGAFIPEIDGLRFVAIASVVAFHLHAQLDRYYTVRFPGIASRLLGHGDRGVSLFFVISGFVLALPFASHRLREGAKVDLRRYFQRRLTRLEPPYVLNLVTCAVLLVVVSHKPGSFVVSRLLASMSYCHSALYGALSAVNPVAWSLEIEVQFYLIMPLLAYVFAIPGALPRRVTLIAAMLVAAILQASWAHGPRVELSILYYVQFFLAGLLLADLYLVRCQRFHKNSAWDVLSLVAWPLVFLLDDGAVLHTLLPFVVVALYWAAFHGRLTNRLLRLPLLTSVGGMCYTIYLYHFLTIAFATRVLGHSVPALEMVGVSLVLICCVSLVFFLLVERPCMDKNWPARIVAFAPRSKAQPKAAELRSVAS